MSVLKTRIEEIVQGAERWWPLRLRDKNGQLVIQGDYDYEVQSVAYDLVNSRIVVLMAGLGGMAIVDPETLVPIATPNDAFSGVDVATQVAFRP